MHRTPTPLSGFHSIGDFVVCLVFQRLRSHLSEACNLTMSVNSGIASQGDLSPEPKGSIRSGEGSEVLPPVSGPASVAPPNSGATHASWKPREVRSPASVHSDTASGAIVDPLRSFCAGAMCRETHIHSSLSFVKVSRGRDGMSVWAHASFEASTLQRAVSPKLLSSFRPSVTP